MKNNFDNRSDVEKYCNRKDAPENYPGEKKLRPVLDFSVDEEKMYCELIYERTKYKMKKLIEMKFKYGVETTELPNINCPLFNKLSKNYEELKKEYKKFIWITINPQQHKWRDALEAVKTMLRDSIWVEKSWFCIEQRKSTGDFEGQHFHILIKDYNISPSSLNRNILRIFKKFCGPSNANAKKEIDKYRDIIDVTWKDYLHLQDKFDYMFGKKFGDKKEEQCKYDIEFRKQNNFPEYWTDEMLRTDKSISKARGGARVGAGRPKKVKQEIEIENKITEVTF